MQTVLHYETSPTAQRMGVEQRARRARMSPPTSHPVMERPQEAPLPTILVAPARKWHFIIDENTNRVSKIKRIIAATCSHFGVDANDLKSSNRRNYICYPRMIAIYVAKKFTNSSLPEIGRRFGDRDHTTVLYAYRKIERLQSDDRVAADCEDIARAIREVI